MADMCSRPGPWSLRRVAGVVTVTAVLGGATGCEAPASDPEAPPAATPATRPPPLSAAHAAAIRDSVRTFLDRWSAGTDPGEWEQMLDWYADDPDFVWMEDGRVRYRSVDEVREGLAGLAGAFSHATTDFSELAVTPLAAGLANVVTRFRTTLHPTAPGTPVEYGGGMTLTVVRTDQGWQVLQGHTSSEVERPG